MWVNHATGKTIEPFIVPTSWLSFKYLFDHLFRGHIIPSQHKRNCCSNSTKTKSAKKSREQPDLESCPLITPQSFLLNIMICLVIKLAKSSADNMIYCILDNSLKGPQTCCPPVRIWNTWPTGWRVLFFRFFRWSRLFCWIAIILWVSVFGIDKSYIPRQSVHCFVNVYHSNETTVRQL